MRAKVIVAVLAGMLFCGLFWLEMPEFLRLSDDISNDFAVNVVRNGARAVPPEAQTSGADATPGFADAMLDPVPTGAPQAGLVARPAGYLHRLCTLRT